MQPLEAHVHHIFSIDPVTLSALAGFLSRPNNQPQLDRIESKEDQILAALQGATPAELEALAAKVKAMATKVSEFDKSTTQP